MVEGFVALTDRRRSRRASTRGELAPLDAPEIARALVRMLNGYLDDALGREPRHRPGARARDGLDDLDPHAVPGPAERAGRPARRAADRRRAVAGPWPAEDGGPRRTQEPGGPAGPRRSAPGERLEVTAVRDALGDDDGHPARSRRGLRPAPHARPPAARATRCTAWVERIDPLTLEPLARSPDLPAGPFWPGGMAAHANGSLHVVTRQPLPPPVARARAAGDACGCPARGPTTRSSCSRDGTLVDEGLRPRRCASRRGSCCSTPRRSSAAATTCRSGEPAIARLSADGDDVYVVGARDRRSGCAGTARGSSATPPGARRYLRPGSSYGWDPVIAGGQLWFIDNGAHDFVTTMRGAGVAPGPGPPASGCRSTDPRRRRARRGLRRCRAARSPTRRSTTRARRIASPTTRPTASSRRSASASGSRRCGGASSRTPRT